MSRRWLLSLLCLSVLFLWLVQLTHAGGELKVDETNTRLLFEKPTAEVVLAIENSTGETFNARVELELLSPQNDSKTNISQVQTIPTGKKTLTIPLNLSFSNFNSDERRQLLWYRLRYRLARADANTTLTEGFISLSQITSDLFEVHLIASDYAREGGRYRTRVQALHPISLKPAANVQIEGELTLEDDGDRGLKLRASKMSDGKGRAVLEFQLPPRFPEYPHTVTPSGGEIKVTAKRGALISEVSGDVLVDQFSKILISTDKPLYQPGQMMHVRALVFSPSRRALANQDVVVKILDPEGTGVYRTEVKTSRFGVISADWSIPENTRLGSYRITVGLDDEENWAQQYSVRISRYDLPNFSVSVEPDRTFYLPGQRAEVKVRADYLFGQPVTRGHVRVVRESNREWNYREQKWDLEEGDKYEADTDAKGIFTAHIDLTEDHEKLAERDYEQFQDISYAAYVTDPTTNRTEQRRFDVRVSREPIHVYVINRDYYSDHNPALPVDIHVSTFYADGSPARCDVRPKVVEIEDAKVKTDKSLPPVRTNRYGLARISGRWPRELQGQSMFRLVVTATDSRRRIGSVERTLYADDDARVKVETDKPLYRAGEPINAVITSTMANETLNVDLVRDSTVIHSERVKLHDGRASISFAYRSGFKDRLTIAAYPDFPSRSNMIGTDTVLYPNNSALKVGLRTSQDTYRPGEEAEVALNVRAAQGSSAESALGLVVFDKAVEERFRTDQEFGDGVSSFYRSLQSFLGFEGQLSGVTFEDLQNLDMSKPVSPDLEMVADVMLRASTNYYPTFHSSDEYDRNHTKYFTFLTLRQVSPLVNALAARYNNTNEHPNDLASLRGFLREANIDFDAIRDPWGIPYRANFNIDKDRDLLDLTSAGADKRFGTSDDFHVQQLSWYYFRPTGSRVDGAAVRYHQQTGGYIRDLDTLRAELAKDGLHLDQWRDRWGQPYRIDFTIRDTKFLTVISSAGPDKQFADRPYTEDDFVVWLSSIDYFEEKRAQLDTALVKYLKSTNQFPQTDQQLREALPGEDLEALKDPWGRPYYRTFKIQTSYSDRVRVTNRSTFGVANSERVEILPVTRWLGIVNFRSVGPDGRAGTIDDFTAGSFSGIVWEQERGQVKPTQANSSIVLTPGNGVIYGTVTDFAGAVVSNANVTLKRSENNLERVTSTNEDGKYTFGDLTPGIYQVRFEAVGFKISIIDQVTVSAGNLTEVNSKLEPGAVTETVTISGGGSNMLLDGVNASVSHSITRNFTLITKSGGSAMETPRLREYFPETLLWQPVIETDKQGRARINFKLADNITTWKVAVVASTEDGRIGTTEKEIKAFQPFFVEHEPPRVLTEGDEISLPVVVRNYLEREQKVNLEIKPESWFSLLGPSQKRTAVVAGDAKRETFDFRVTASIDDGKQRITAFGSDANDAIEKPVSVHPDGQEISVTEGDIVGSTATMEMSLPENSIPKSTRAELKIYPNLMAHVIEGVEAIMQRPYGCAEQTISSTYPSLLLLSHQKRTGEELAVRARAERYLKNGYSRVLNYRDEQGGFSYWGRGDANVALTAYALRFFTEASDVMEIDKEIIKETREWLLKHQQPDGSWESYKYWRPEDQKRRDTVLTSYVARVLAMTDAKLNRDKSVESADVAPALKRAFDYLAQQANRIDEPYLLASLALALIDVNETQRARPIIELLRSLAHTEGSTMYWALETNTPFYGWGIAGRVETTALVVQALKRYCDAAKCETDTNLNSRALLFLLKQKDRYGVWYSTQATINVFDALLLMFSKNGNSPGESTAEVLVNGSVVKTIQMPAANRLISPITVDLAQSVRTGKNMIEIRRPSGLPFASAQARLNYYVPWPKAIETHHAENVSNDLRLTARFDKSEAKINDTITCHVEAERIGFRGYGMMLAEIGLPPGADVDRGSLETAMKGSGWAINQYDVLPDRVVLYLWPSAGGVKFDFKFRPRFGLNAKSAPSVVYDYYNPEARVTVAPTQFKVKN